MREYVTVFLFILLQLNLQSQVVNDSTISKMEQELERTKIAQVFHFKDVIIDKENSIIRVQFKFNSNDAAKNDTLWRILKTDFRKQKKTGIREYLYFLSINIFRINTPKDVLLEIRQSYISQDCPFIQFYFNEDTGKFTGDEKEKICMAAYDEDEINLESFRYFKKEYIKKNEKLTINAIYSILNAHFKRFYKNGGFEKNSTKQKFSSSYIVGKPMLEFQITNLKKEVLYDAGDNFVYTILEFLYPHRNYDPYEYLKFRITITFENNKMGIKVEIKGRYGSGYYQNRKWEKMNDMDLGFPNYINEYAEKISAKIVRTISNNKNFKN